MDPENSENGLRSGGQTHRRQGIGRTIFQEVEQQARTRGAQKVELTAWNHNTIALKAYESYGMKLQRSIYESWL